MNLPFSEQHEQALISRIIDDPLVHGVAVLDEFDDCPFYTKECSLIFSAIQRIDIANISMTTIVDYLLNTKQLDDVGGLSEVSRIASIPSYGNFDLHFSWVKKLYVQRQIIQAVDTSVSALYDPMCKVDEAVDQLRADFSTAMLGEKDTMMTAAEMLEETDKAIEAGDFGFYTHVHKIDSVIAPIPPGSFVVIGGRMGMGKTTLYNSMQLHMGMQKQASALFSMEMPVQQVTKRMVAALARMNSKPEEVHKHWSGPEFVVAREQFGGLPIYCKDTPGMTEKQIVREIKAMHSATGCKWYAIDHIGKVSCSKNCRGNSEQETRIVSNALKEVAMEIGGVIVGISQLNRGAEGEAPGLGNISRSDAIAQDADVVIMVHGQRETENDEQLMAVLRGEPIDMSIIISKSRHTAPGRKVVPFYKHCSLFANDVQTEQQIEDSHEN